jgi:cytochrome c
MGAPLGHVAGYAYSEALKGKGGNWTWDEMSAWLRNPKAYAPGTKMTFAGVPDGQDRADLMLYLNTQGSNLPLPAAPAASADPADASQVEARGNESSPDVNGAAPKQPIVNEGQGASAPKGGGEMRPDANLKGGAEAK